MGKRPHHKQKEIEMANKMIHVRVTTQTADGKQSSYETSVNGTLASARDYFLNRVITDEVYCYEKDRFVEVKKLVVAVNLVGAV